MLLLEIKTAGMSGTPGLIKHQSVFNISENRVELQTLRTKSSKLLFIQF